MVYVALVPVFSLAPCKGSRFLWLRVTKLEFSRWMCTQFHFVLLWRMTISRRKATTTVLTIVSGCIHSYVPCWQCCICLDSYRPLAIKPDNLRYQKLGGIQSRNNSDFAQFQLLRFASGLLINLLVYPLIYQHVTYLLAYIHTQASVNLRTSPRHSPLTPCLDMVCRCFVSYLRCRQKSTKPFCLSPSSSFSPCRCRLSRLGVSSVRACRQALYVPFFVVVLGCLYCLGAVVLCFCQWGKAYSKLDL